MTTPDLSATNAADPATERARAAIETVFRDEGRRVFATLIRLLGDFDLAEEALQDAFTAAVAQWPKGGVPDNPRAWLVSAGRFKAIDTIRRRTRFDASLATLGGQMDATAPAPDEAGVEDDQLRLIFTCCHPALAADARVALTLREVCGLTTEEIAHAYLTAPSTLAQRIVRAKNKIKSAGIPYVVPAPDDLPERLDTVLQVIYLVFNEGYSASAGAALTRADLSGEALRLGRLLLGLLPQPEVMGLLALMLLHEARRAARTNAEGDLVLLDDQDRTRWDQTQITEGVGLVRRALAAGGAGPYVLQGAIVGVHALAATAAATDWGEIVALYDLLLRSAPSPVVELNRAVALARRDGPAAGLAVLEAILARGALSDYHLAYSVQAELNRQLGRSAEARAAYQKALSLARHEPERRFLERQLSSLPE